MKTMLQPRFHIIIISSEMARIARDRIETRNDVSVNSKRYHPPGNPRAHFQLSSNASHPGNFFSEMPGIQASFPAPFILIDCTLLHHIQELNH